MIWSDEDLVSQAWHISLTHENPGLKVLAHRRGILLKIVGVVIERAVVFPCVESVCILHHFLVESVEQIMRNDIVDDDETVVIQASYGNLQVLRGQASVLNLHRG